MKQLFIQHSALLNDNPRASNEVISMEGIIYALIPPVMMVVLIYFLDKKEHEPIQALVSAFCSGMVSVILLVCVQVIFRFVFFWDIPTPESDLPAYLMYHLLIIGILSGGCKLAAFMVTIWKSPNFDYTFDGIVYAVTISMGFAVLDNIGRIYLSPSTGNLMTNALIYVPATAAFSVIMGLFISRAKLASVDNDRNGFIKNFALAFAVPSVLQGIYSALINGGSDIFQFLSFIFVAALDLVVIAVLKNEMENDSQLYFTSFTPDESKGFDPIGSISGLLSKVEHRGEDYSYDNDSLIKDFDTERPEDMDTRGLPTKQEQFDDVLENVYGEIRLSGNNELANSIYTLAAIGAKKNGLLIDEGETTKTEQATAPAPVKTDNTALSQDDQSWTCPSCGSFNMLTYCAGCGKKRPDDKN